MPPDAHWPAVRRQWTAFTSTAGRVEVAVRARRVELALARGEVSTVVDALTVRPGELLRRADHLLRVAAGPADEDRVLAALAAAAPRVAPAVLLSALGALRTRAVAGERRVFFPSGRTGTAHVVATAALSAVAGFGGATLLLPVFVAVFGAAMRWRS